LALLLKGKRLDKGAIESNTCNSSFTDEGIFVPVL
jgi:hypothetical protein